MKVYDASDNYLAACVEAESAAAVVALSGSGATIRNGHSRKKAVWVEGGELQSAAESYDFVAVTIRERTRAAHQIDTKLREVNHAVFQR